MMTMCDLPLLFAAASYDEVGPVQFAAVVVSISAILGMLLVGTKLKQSWFPGEQKKESFELSPNPLPVEIAKTLATKDELNELEVDVNGRFDRIETQISEERSTARIAIGNVHKRIDTVVENTSEIKGELKQVNANLGRLLDQQIKN